MVGIDGGKSYSGSLYIILLHVIVSISRYIKKEEREQQKTNITVQTTMSSSTATGSPERYKRLFNLSDRDFIVILT